MFGNIFFHDSIKTSMAAFGSLFNDISIVRRDVNGDEIERIKVPIAYGPREKYLVRLADDPDLQREVAVTLPRISFEITGWRYDADRKLVTMTQNTRVFNDDTKRRVYNPVPYTMTVDLHIMCKYMNDMNQIVEQVLPWFTPDYTITKKEIPNELELLDDIPVILTGVDFSDNYEDDWLNRRNLIYTLSFDLQMNLYGPVKEQGVIREAIVDVKIPTGGETHEIDQEDLECTPRVQRTTVVPDPIDAGPNDDYGFTETFEEFNDGKVRDPVTGDDVDLDPDCY